MIKQASKYSINNYYCENAGWVTVTWCSIQPRPSFWYGSSGISRLEVGSHGFSQDFRTISLGSTGIKSSSISFLLSFSLIMYAWKYICLLFQSRTKSTDVYKYVYLWETSALELSSSSRKPSIASTLTISLLKMVHSKCCHLVNRPQSPSKIIPTLTESFIIFSSHLLHSALEDLAFSIT